jgi:hypothetical protein
VKEVDSDRRNTQGRPEIVGSDHVPGLYLSVSAVLLGILYLRRAKRPKVGGLSADLMTESWLDLHYVVCARIAGNNCPSILLRTSLKDTVLDSSNVGVGKRGLVWEIGDRVGGCRGASNEGRVTM